MTTLSHKHKILIGKAVSKDARARSAKNLGPGEYEATTIVKISGPFTIGQPYEQAIMLTFPWQKLALMLASRVPRHVLDAVLREVKSETAPGELKEHVSKMWKQINKDGRQLCAGKITGRPSIEVLESH